MAALELAPIWILLIIVFGYIVLGAFRIRVTTFALCAVALPPLKKFERSPARFDAVRP